MLVYIHAGSYHRQGGKILTQVRDAFSSLAYILTLMRKLLVFQHSAREPLGVLDPMLRQAGFRVRYVNFSRDPGAQLDVRRYNGLIVLGGQMNVDQADQYPHLTTEISAIKEALRLEIPILGICLGAQLLAAALGANVRPNNVREIGWYRLHPTAAAQSDRLCRTDQFV